MLEQAIVVLSDRLTPLRDRITRIQGNGVAHLWNQRTRLDTLAAGPLGLVNLFYSDGNIPTQNDPAYVQKSAAYAYLGMTAVITGPMIASGRSYMDIEAEIAEAALRAVIQARHRMSQFLGLDIKINSTISGKAKGEIPSQSRGNPLNLLYSLV